ncbi:hypothetical protein BO85DRAFT_445255 [Aspergillus piperis CBS 112811]|uniref:Uncharacterized protein n=1 Tax=Aspergillus piperis CBS 112811 TaxID=1448313 RepID=A0A8G1VTI9_9EURO|nr:hypothetical protein BO85DRAFT_445255 [Aspergillus piperis CBS 112811]RAH61853.1 hypothetical protein BO85DRAFT_445255 [Aspergillus piperis CBS 112811]
MQLLSALQAGLGWLYLLYTTIRCVCMMLRALLLRPSHYNKLSITNRPTDRPPDPPFLQLASTYLLTNKYL